MKTAIQFGTLTLLLFFNGTATGDEKPRPEEPRAETTAEEIATDFAKFPAETPKKYADKLFLIKGEVEKVDGKNIYLKHYRAVGSVFVILQTPNMPNVTVGEHVQALGSMTAVFAGSVFFKCRKLKGREQIHGLWRLTGVRNGVPEREPDWRFEDGTIVFSYFVAVASPIDLKRGVSATYKLDPSQKPSTIDLKLGSGQEVRGIYLLADDVLIICLSKPGAARPSEFILNTEVGQELLVFQREEPKARNLK